MLDGDEWVINGQKVWTTQAQFADYCFLLARTDPDAPKHAGISYLLVPMKQDGIEVRGIIQPDGTAEFNEVFFTDARCPKENVVGGLNNGWKVANTTLGHERGMSATTGYRRFEQEFDSWSPRPRRNGQIDDPIVRQGLTRYYSKIQILRINGLRTLTPDAQRQARTWAWPRSALTNKMFWSEMHRDAMELALDIFGAASMLVDAGPGGGALAGRHAGQGPRQLQAQPDDLVVLLLPVRDHLGRHRRDPAQHRRRAGPRPAREPKAANG